MPVLNSSDFVFQVSTLKKDGQGQDVSTVTANGEDKYVLLILPVAWNGVAYFQDVIADIYFSDGRPPLSSVTVPKDGGYLLELTSTVARKVEVTIVDRTSGSSYFKESSFLFV